MARPDISTLQSWHENSKFEQIVSLIEKIPTEQRDYELDSHLARAYNNLSHYDAALQLLYRYTDEGEHDPLWHFRIGYAHFYQSQYDASIAAFERVLQLDPDDDVAAYLLAQSRSEQARNGHMPVAATREAAATRREADPDSIKALLPFIWVHLDGGRASVILNVGSYRAELFLEREDEGFVGSGYDWASLAQVFIVEQLPELMCTIRFDPEADMYAAYSDDTDALMHFSLAFKSACEDDSIFRDMFSRAELD